MRRALREQSTGALCVACSGGADSSALLHALAGLPEARARGLRALHVDHGLHPDSGTWANHVRSLCDALGVPCDVTRVRVENHRGEGLEAAARRARHAAFGQALREGEWLLLAHHRDDQAETVLLKLLRGAGPEGLGGMRERRPFGRGRLWRPLLPLSRAQLRAYAEAHALACIEDPSNADARLSRNYLRHEVLPRLAAHWPQAVDSILHSAALSRDAADALRAQWQPLFERLHDPTGGSLDLPGWLALPQALRGPLLDYWLHARGLPAPTAAQRAQIERQSHAKPGQTPCIRWPGAELHLWKGRLWALPPQPAVDPTWRHDWHGEPLPLPDGGELRLAVPDARLPAALTVRLRRGGERIRPAGDAHTRELRDLFQQAALPPWRRPACPLLYRGDELLAVADRWISAAGTALFDAAGGRPRWRPGA
ncbi:tRNA lysidine(34) synthetase TilS [Fulvimonas sp. R45]|uniref:tRNA lysidine(34) synthetase TilS n=1 Tax=Fulvimonas sp. R45 TaxID=3045937 RepID=UPI00265F8C1A|nr:tRNA lysidine(34) synthetase TilS [Fulvimonas sp. R45]MDO1529881.1 tRNA lysidine(34) synthetase TilS [Fulvimonas sp. R45]